MKRVFENTETKTVVTNIFNKDDEKMIEHLLRKMIGVGEDVELDDNLKETPHRVLKLWTEMTEGYREDPAKHLEKSFPINSPNLADDEDGFDSNATPTKFHKGIVVVSTDAWSNCCHHLAPMHCRVDVAYIPGQKVVGLSKIVRTVKAYGRRLNLQEAWGENIANAMMNKLNALGCMVRISGIHSCVSMRGAQEQTSKTTTMAIRGCFADDVEARMEAISMMDKNELN
jgi:GTP cyclohydrolase I